MYEKIHIHNIFSSVSSVNQILNVESKFRNSEIPREIQLSGSLCTPVVSVLSFGGCRAKSMLRDPLMSRSHVSSSSWSILGEDTIGVPRHAFDHKATGARPLSSTPSVTSGKRRQRPASALPVRYVKDKRQERRQSRTAFLGPAPATTSKRRVETRGKRLVRAKARRGSQKRKRKRKRKRRGRRQVTSSVSVDNRNTDEPRHHIVFPDSPDSHYRMGLLHERENDDAGGMRNAIQYYTLSALGGHLRAAYRLGMLLKQSGCTSAAEWFSRAAEQGDAKSAFELAKIYENEGSGDDFCVEKAKILYLDSASRGYALAQFRLGELFRCGGASFPQSWVKALEWYKKAGLQQHVEALWWCGFILAKGWGGVVKSCLQAAEWWEKAAKLGHVGAQAGLASLYVRGKGSVTNAVRIKNRKRGAKLAETAAKRGNAHAQNIMGCLYYNGELVERDTRKCDHWLRRSAEGGDKNGITNLRVIHHAGIGVPSHYPPHLRAYGSAGSPSMLSI